MTVRSTLGAMGIALALGACSGGNETALSQAGQVETLYQNLRGALRTAPEPLPQLTPDLIANLPVATLELVIEERGAPVYLVPFSDRTDNRRGALRTWRSADDVQFVFRNGVLVGTRGLGNNIGSANVAPTVSALQTGTPQPGTKTLFLVNGDNGIDRIDLTCRMSSAGAQDISIVETTRNTIRLREDCTGPGHTVTNEYWVSRTGGTVWQTRQWAGPEIGYVRTRLLKQ